MNIYRFFSTSQQYEIGAGLVEYTPLILFLSCILFSLFQIVAQGDARYLLLIGAIVTFLVIYVGSFILYDEKIRKKKSSDKQKRD